MTLNEMKELNIKHVVFEKELKYYTNGIYITKDDKVVILYNDAFSEYPIKYDDGTIVYEHPEAIPKYLKDKVDNAFRILYIMKLIRKPNGK